MKERKNSTESGKKIKVRKLILDLVKVYISYSDQDNLQFFFIQLGKSQYQEYFYFCLMEKLLTYFLNHFI